MRVLHVARRFAPMRGGIERYVHDLAAAQTRAGHRVTVVTLDRDVIGDVGGRIESRHDLVEAVDRSEVEV